jgi:hypothetical protein
VKSATLPSFWTAYRSLQESIKKSARKSYNLWEENPFHPSLHFKYVNTEEDIWSVRITRGYRALGILENDMVTWFWIRGHDEYMKLFS